MGMDLTDTQKELGTILRKRLNDDSAYVAVMVGLVSNQIDANDNCNKLLRYLKENSNANYNSIMKEVERIIIKP